MWNELLENVGEELRLEIQDLPHHAGWELTSDCEGHEPHTKTYVPLSKCDSCLEDVMAQHVLHTWASVAILFYLLILKPLDHGPQVRWDASIFHVRQLS